MDKTKKEVLTMLAFMYCRLYFATNNLIYAELYQETYNELKW